ncbi:MAG: ABC transporter permease [Bacteroidales bacterium]|nr:ABC transporter permease [Bacteroidales bacterium]
MSKAFGQLVYIEFLSFFREPGALFWSFFFPVVLAWGLGIAFSSRMETSKNIGLILTHPSYADSLRSIGGDTAVTDSVIVLSIGNKNSGIIHFRFRQTNWDEASVLLKRGTISLIVEEKDFKPVFHFDPQNSEGKLAYLQTEPLLNKREDVYDRGEISMIRQKGIRYIDFLIPGLLSMNIMMSIMWGVSYTMIERRSKKLLRRMVATPMKKAVYLYAQFFTRFVLCVLEAIIIMAFAYYYFGITVEGSLFTFMLLFIAGFISFSGFSVLISSRTSNTYIGNGMINFFVMPMMLLSGIYFSYHNFPDVIIPYIQLLPLTILADHIRAVFNEGAGLAQSIKAIGILSLLGIVTFSIGLRIFKWY